MGGVCEGGEDPHWTVMPSKKKKKNKKKREEEKKKRMAAIYDGFKPSEI